MPVEKHIQCVSHSLFTNQSEPSNIIMAYQPYDPHYLPPIHHHPPPPAPPLPLPQYHHPQQDNGINTLFVSGLPDDVQAREIHNLFRRKPGFDFCQLKYTGRGSQVHPLLSHYPEKILNFFFVYRESIGTFCLFPEKNKKKSPFSQFNLDIWM